MRRLNIKVKYLIIMILMILAVYIIIPFIYSQIAHSYDKKGQRDYAAIFYEKAFNMIPDKLKSDKDIYDYANILSDGIGQDSLYLIFPMGRSGIGNGMPPTDQDIDKAIALYERLLDKYPSSPWSKRASVRLCEIYMYRGIYDKAEEYIKKDLTASDSKLIYDLYSSMGEYEKGTELLKQKLAIDNKHFDIDVYSILGDFYIKLGDYSKAISSYEAAITELKKTQKPSPDSYYSDKIKEFKALIERTSLYNDKALKAGSCKGQVTIDGKGVMGVRVYIKDGKLYPDDYFSSRVPYPYTLTDKGGFYSFENVLPGEYEIGIGISPNLIIGKSYLANKDSQKFLSSSGTLNNNFEFNTPFNIKSPTDEAAIQGEEIKIVWESISSADHYRLILGFIDESGSMSTTFADNIKTSKFTINVDDIIARSMDFGLFMDENKPTKGSLLGVYGGGRLLYGVEAYDKAGRIIGSTMPILETDKTPRYFTITFDELEGDRLIKKDKYREAASWFENYLKSNPKDIHSLYVLSQYHEDYTKDHYQTANYLKKLYDVTGNEQYKRHLFLTLYDSGKYEEIIRLYNESSDKDNYHGEAAKAYARIKDLKKAYDLYGKAILHEHSNDEVIRYILFALLNSHFNKAQSAVEKIDQSYSDFENARLVKCIWDLKDKTLSQEFASALKSYLTYNSSYEMDLKKAFEKVKAGSEKEILGIILKS